MGGNQSTHKYTIDNENDANIIKISEGVAKRLSEASDNTRRSYSQDETITNVPKSLSPEDTINYPYYTISALEVHQQRTKELEYQEEYWKERMNNLKKKHDEIDVKLKNEYNKAKNIFEDYKVKKIKERVDLCKKEQANLQTCYTNNKQKILNCAEIFTQYADCVNSHREKYMPYP